MTGFKSKKDAALDEEGMYLVHHTAQQDATMQSLKDLKRSVCDEVGKAAFAQPAKRPWVDLTDEEIQDCDPHEDCWHLFKIARAVLAKSKEKNT